MKKQYPKLKVYTKTGDKGETGLYGGKRVPKFHARVEAYGTVDELNSAIGVTIAEAKSEKRKAKNLSSLTNELIHIQHDLFDIGASLANPKQSAKFKVLASQHASRRCGRSGQSSKFFLRRATDFEKLIDKLADQIPAFHCFVLPGGSKGSACIHLCRTICRRAERRIVELSQKETINPDILIYINRLSDLLFTMARFVNFKEKKKETIWQEQF